ncbi:hypothetical protein M8J77_021092 [Diaphorina citri]|nr:hypothetical protein M8J77_021092 [Diaphorina citri]
MSTFQPEESCSPDQTFVRWVDRGPYQIPAIEHPYLNSLKILITVPAIEHPSLNSLKILITVPAIEHPYLNSLKILITVPAIESLNPGFLEFSSESAEQDS